MNTPNYSQLTNRISQIIEASLNIRYSNQFIILLLIEKIITLTILIISYFIINNPENYIIKHPLILLCCMSFFDIFNLIITTHQSLSSLLNIEPIRYLALDIIFFMFYILITSHNLATLKYFTNIYYAHPICYTLFCSIMNYKIFSVMFPYILCLFLMFLYSIYPPHLKVVTFPSEELFKTDVECIICMTHYKEKEKIMILPCYHSYHEVCVKYWLMRSQWCPLCKKRVLSMFIPPEQDNIV